MATSAGLVVAESAGEVMVVGGLPPEPSVGSRAVPVVGLAIPGAVGDGLAAEGPVPDGAVVGSVAGAVVGDGWAGPPPVGRPTVVLADWPRRS